MYVAETEVEEADQEGVKFDKRGLPPIGRIKMPPGMKITSTQIRWLNAVGYEAREIAPFLGCRYQQVRNVLQNPPKRAAREDVPPLVVEVTRLSEDMLEIADEEAMRANCAASRSEHFRERREINRKRRIDRSQLGEDEEGNEAMDNEDYQGSE
jgi:hypothetical protein